MQIVIDINENTYNQIREGFYEENTGKMAIAIIDGIVLPKHGRLIDVDVLIKGDCFFETEMDLNNAPTILESNEENAE